MSLSIDHIFVCTDQPDATVQALTEAGYGCGATRTHQGQGTTNACFYFANAYLEVLWMANEAELRSPAIAPLGLWERIHWRETGACPFGIALRGERPPAAAWDYSPPYLPPGVSIPIVTPYRALNEPFVFISFSAVPPSEHPVTSRDPRNLVSVGLELTGPSTMAQIAPKLIRISESSAYSMQLELSRE